MRNLSLLVPCVCVALSAGVSTGAMINASFMCTYTAQLRVGDGLGGFTDVGLSWGEVRWDTMLVSRGRGDTGLIVDTTCSMSGTITANSLYQGGGSSGVNPLFEATSVRIQHENHPVNPDTDPEHTYELYDDADLYKPKWIMLSFMTDANEVLVSYRLNEIVTLTNTGPARFMQTLEPVTFSGAFPAGKWMAPEALLSDFAAAPPMYLDATTTTVRLIPTPGAMGALALGGVVISARRRRD